MLLLNNLMLNRDKTEAIVISAVNTRAHATVDVVIDVCGCVVTTGPCARDIGVWLDSTTATLFYTVFLTLSSSSSTSYSSQYCAGQRLTPHIRTLEVRPES